MRTHQKIAEACKKLPIDQQKKILETVESMINEQSSSYNESDEEKGRKRTPNPPCPFCLSTQVKKTGTKNGKQRYKCNTCGVAFTSTTHTLQENSHSSKEDWRKLIIDTMNGMSIDYTAEALELHHDTVFNMRHKFLMALVKYLAQDPIVLKEVSELDETYVLESFKGTKFGPDATREPRLHGEKASKRGLSGEQVCICAGVQRQQGPAYAETVNRAKPSSEEIKDVFENHIESGSVIFTGDAKGYNVLEDAIDCAVESVDVAEQKERKVANLNNVNSFHSFIKDRYGRYRGVATKYLNRYNALFSSSYRNRKEMVDRLCDAMLNPGPVDYSNLVEQINNKDILWL